MEESRTSGLNSMDILHCRRLIMDSLELFELSMAEDDENEWLFMSLGALNLLEYVHMNSLQHCDLGFDDQSYVLLASSLNKI